MISKKIYTKPAFLVVETMCLVGVPLILVLVFPQLLPFRLVVMGASIVYIYFVMKNTNISLATIGIRKKNAAMSIKHVFIPTMVTSFGLIILNFYFPVLTNFREIVTEAHGLPVWLIIPFYVVVSVPLQEFVLRGFYISRLERVSKNPIFLLIYSSAIFAIIHGAFQNKLLVPMAFFLGLYLGYVFLKFRSLAGPMFVHAVLGAVFLYLVLR